MRIYFDHNATTPIDPAVIEISCAAMRLVGNPSSIHAEGRKARSAVEGARTQVATLLSGQPEEVVFTSGGTEADCLGVVGLAHLARSRGRPDRVVTTAIEHPAVLGAVAWLGARGTQVAYAPVDEHGTLDHAQFRALCEAGVGVVALSLANHELGTVQDIAQAAAVATDHGALIHCDLVQAAGKRSLDVGALGVHTAAISGHKMYGPKGVGALWVRADTPLQAFIDAGHQERERRPGTENVVGIAGMGMAAELAHTRLVHDAARVHTLTSHLENGLARLDGARIHGAGAARIGNTVNVGFDGALGEAVVAALDLAGFAASTGAACTSGSVAPSAVLLGIGQPPERAVEAVRFSLGRDTTEAHVQALLDILPDIVARARAFR